MPLWPTPPKPHFRGGQVDDGVVDTAAPEVDPPRDRILYEPVFAEQVQRQRGGVGFNDLEYIFQVREGQHRQNGPEDLLPHDRAVQADIVQNGGGDAQPVIVLPARIDVFTLHQSHQASVLAFIDDASVIRLSSGAFTILFMDLRFQ